jgi:hypothetical protein
VDQLQVVLPRAASAAPCIDTFPQELPLDLGSLERLAIREALRRVNGNRTHAARLLGIGLRTLRNKLRAWREQEAPQAKAAGGHFLPGRSGHPPAGGPLFLAPSPARVSQERGP